MIENLKNMVAFYEGQIASRSLSAKLGVSNPITLYAMATGETISKETSDKTKLIQVLEGRLQVTQGAEPLILSEGALLSIAPDTPHDFLAVENCKVLQIEV